MLLAGGFKAILRVLTSLCSSHGETSTITLGSFFQDGSCVHTFMTSDRDCLTLPKLKMKILLKKYATKESNSTTRLLCMEETSTTCHMPTSDLSTEKISQHEMTTNPKVGF